MKANWIKDIIDRSKKSAVKKGEVEISIRGYKTELTIYPYLSKNQFEDFVLALLNEEKK